MVVLWSWAASNMLLLTGYYKHVNLKKKNLKKGGGLMFTRLLFGFFFFLFCRTQYFLLDVSKPLMWN